VKVLVATVNGLNKFYKFFFYFAGVILMVLLAVSFFVVVSRSFFRLSFVWSDELQRFLMIAMVFFAIPYMASNKTFLVVDLAEIFFGKNKKLHYKTLLIGNFVSLALVIYLIFPCTQIARNSTRIFSTALGLPMSYMYTLMPMSFIFSAVAIAKNLLKHIVIDRCVSDTGEVR